MTKENEILFTELFKSTADNTRDEFAVKLAQICVTHKASFQCYEALIDLCVELFQHSYQRGMEDFATSLDFAAVERAKAMLAANKIDPTTMENS